MKTVLDLFNHRYNKDQKFSWLEMIDFAVAYASQFTPDISEEEIGEAASEYLDTVDEDNYGVMFDFIAGAKWALSKTRNETPPKDGAKWASEWDRLMKAENAFDNHKVHKDELIKFGLGLGEFLRALKELNN